MKTFEFQKLKIPFRLSFKHASADRSITQSLLVKVKSENNLMGIGEGCPREYVTGEDLDTGIKFLQSIKKPMSQIQTVEELSEWVSLNQDKLDKNPAAWCAMELALLDLFGREQDQGLEELLGSRPLHKYFKYTAVLGSSSLEAFQTQVNRYLKLGFLDFKVKITGSSKDDREKLTFLRERAGLSARIRLDANNYWSDYNQAKEYIQTLPKDIFAWEEPLKAFDISGMVSLYEETGIQIILDESVLTLKHLDDFSKYPGIFIINARVSKMGGMFRTINLCHKAKEAELPIVVGAQVGESSILTRAALTVANECGSSLLAQEGAFGTLLLMEDLVENPLMFGKGGELQPTLFLNPQIGGNQLDYKF